MIVPSGSTTGWESWLFSVRGLRKWVPLQVLPLLSD